MNARETILGRVRESLVQASLEAAHADDGRERPGAGEAAPADLARRFRERLESVGGTLRSVRDAGEAARALAELARDRGVTRVAFSDAPLVSRALAALPDGVERLEASAARERLLAAELGVSTAQWAIAETGTLVLESARERHRLVSLLPPVHVALLARRSILATLEDALAVLRSGPGLSSPAVTWITGPSRTADIELVLVVGVHGPRELHVLLLDDA